MLSKKEKFPRVVWLFRDAEGFLIACKSESEFPSYQTKIAKYSFEKEGNLKIWKEIK